MTDEVAVADIADDDPYQVMPDLSDDEYKAVKESIQRDGFRESDPVILVRDGDDDGLLILDGHHRITACRELGIEEVPAVIREELSESERRELAWRVNMQRRHLDDSQKRDLIERRIEGLMARDEHKNDEELGEELGVSRQWVAEVRQQMAAAGKIASGCKFATSQQKRERTRELIEDDPERSNRDIADEAGVSRTTVGNVRDDLDSDDDDNDGDEVGEERMFAVRLPGQKVSRAAEQAGYDNPAEHIADIYLDYLDD